MKHAGGSVGGRYLIVGAVCAALNNILLIGADWVGLHYSAAIALTIAITLPIAYFSHALWTFSSQISIQSFARFVAGSFSSVVVAAALVAGLRGWIGMPMLFAAPIATILMVLYNFVMTRWAVSNRKPPSRDFI